MDIVKREDRYAEIFMNAYKSLNEQDQGVIFETRVKSDEKIVTPEYLKASLRLTRKVFEEDESLGLLTLRGLLPKDVLVSSELFTELEDYFVKGKVK